MPFDRVRWVVCRYPVWIVAGWLVTVALISLTAPSLTRLAAEGQAKLLPLDAESSKAAQLVKMNWPDQAYDAMAVAVLHRREARLTDADHEFARKLAERFRTADGRPAEVLRVLGPGSRPEIASRMISGDARMELVAVPLSAAFVSPAAHRAVAWLNQQANALGTPPAGLELLWSGDAVIGRDYMEGVKQSLDRAAIATVFLLLAVLLAVYRSFILALVPLLTIGLSLLLARGLLGWLAWLGWEVSPLVELFLVVILFGCGTDFCLFLSWRFGEHWNSANPAGAMRATLKRSLEAIATSAGTVIAGLLLMGTTRFKLFSSTGPSVALGLAVTVGACFSLTPALLILLAKYRPRSFRGLTRPPSGFWDELGHKVLARPVLTWVVTVLILVPAGVLGLKSEFVQDLLTELPARTSSVTTARLIADRFGPGFVAPLTVVLQSPTDLKKSEGLALVDDVSRLLSHQRQLAEVRSATQPLGSAQPLERARIASRLGEVNEGFSKMSAGARMLREGLIQGSAKIRTAMQIERFTGLNLTGSNSNKEEKREPLATGLLQATEGFFGIGRKREPAKKVDDEAAATKSDTPKAAAKAEDPRDVLLRELTRAADGAKEIGDGALRAREEVAKILDDPVGRRALNRLLITPEDVKEHPELAESFAAYIAPDGKTARFDVTQRYRMFSADAMEQVETIRSRLREYLDEIDAEGDTSYRALVTGANAHSADIWALTTADQRQTWIIVPLGVFLVLWFTLRDPWACLNLIATMILTYAFALGITHLVFVTWLGTEGLDWKVPLFLFVLLVAVGVDYNVFLMTRLLEESKALGLRTGIVRAIAHTGGLISSAAAITACSFASFLFSPLGSIRQLGFALVVGITIDAVLVRPLLVPIGHWLIHRRSERKRPPTHLAGSPIAQLARVAD